MKTVEHTLEGKREVLASKMMMIILANLYYKLENYGAPTDSEDYKLCEEMKMVFRVGTPWFDTERLTELFDRAIDLHHNRYQLSGRTMRFLREIYILACDLDSVRKAIYGLHENSLSSKEFVTLTEELSDFLEVDQAYNKPDDAE